MKKNTVVKLAGAAALLAGCQSMKKTAQKDDFPAENDGRSYRRLASSQEAAGARHDGTLNHYHFDGDHLNSLGEHKLSMMLKDNDHAFPVVVYMNLPEDGHMKTRQEAVSTFLVDAGLHEPQMRFEVGPNPKATSSAAANMARLSKTESESPVASNPTNSSAGGYGTGGGSATESAGK